MTGRLIKIMDRCHTPSQANTPVPTPSTALGQLKQSHRGLLKPLTSKDCPKHTFPYFQVDSCGHLPPRSTQEQVIPAPEANTSRVSTVLKFVCNMITHADSIFQLLETSTSITLEVTGKETQGDF
jgi:hypothetical protein